VSTENAIALKDTLVKVALRRFSILALLSAPATVAVALKLEMTTAAVAYPVSLE
jgi:hypothetical protein